MAEGRSPEEGRVRLRSRQAEQHGGWHPDGRRPEPRGGATDYSARTVVFSAGTMGGASFHSGVPSSGLAAG
jgi:hypothetical protein